MELVERKIIDPLEEKATIQKGAGVLNYFTTLRHISPGPLSGGACRSLLFPETEDLGYELVLCQLDIALRKILWEEDGSLCLLDWASVGYYPRLFEFCMQWIIEGKDGSFNSLLLEYLLPADPKGLNASPQKHPLLSLLRT
ncbi:kinase-like protein [Penicillium hordei]|uniref:Kinase-like protein n=1 Tax=Penicillium hordei TaxID=40994 RepID=A0AAD6GSN8_9EURO|nr:kinase-like protein [Penicillium hordei]KAJ5588658.1 kinase-like protein [Penicillium hordei]